MNNKQTPFGLLFADVNMVTQEYLPMPTNIDYEPNAQRSKIGKYWMGPSGTWGTTSCEKDSKGDIVGTDSDSQQDDH